MSDGYWWAAYTLFGAAFVVAFYEITKHAIKKVQEDVLQPPDAEEKETILLVEFLDAHPPAKAFIALFFWVIWPVLFVWAMYVLVVIGYDEIKWRLTK